MTSATLEKPAPTQELVEEVVGQFVVDEERHTLVWIRNDDFTVSVIVDRPKEGGEKVRVVACFGREEGGPELEALLADFRSHYVDCVADVRIRPRPLQPSDLSPAEPFGEGARNG